MKDPTDTRSVIYIDISLKFLASLYVTYSKCIQKWNLIFSPITLILSQMQLTGFLTSSTLCVHVKN